MRKTAIILTLVSLSQFLFSQDFIFSSETDLNSDNKSDIIKVEAIGNPYGNPYEFKLTVNDSEIIGKFWDGTTDGFKIVDINKRDKYKEIAVHTPGPSSDDEYLIYRYSRDTIYFMNHLSSRPTFVGNGIVYFDNWEGFWTKRDKYLLDQKEMKLKLIAQAAYYVGLKVKIKEGFVIYKETDLVNKVALLSSGSEIEIVLCKKSKEGNPFDNDRYLVKSKSKLIGWVSLKTLYENSALPTAD